MEIPQAKQAKGFSGRRKLKLMTKVRDTEIFNHQPSSDYGAAGGWTRMDTDFQIEDQTQRREDAKDAKFSLPRNTVADFSRGNQNQPQPR
jgi:hypothetical protein